MKDKTKRNLVLLGGSIVCVALLVGIGMRFQSPPPKEDVLPPVSSTAPEANPQPIDTTRPSVNPQPIDISGGAGAGNKEEGSTPPSQVPDQTDHTEQQIQPDVVKPSPPPKDALPEDGSTPVIVDHDKVTSPPPSSSSSGSSDEPQHGDTKDGMIYVEGFGWIKDEGGGGQGSTVGNEGDELTGNKVGIME